MEQNKVLTTAEKREFIEILTELTRNDVLNRADRNSIYYVCMAACSRETSKMIREE